MCLDLVKRREGRRVGLGYVSVLLWRTGFKGRIYPMYAENSESLQMAYPKGRGASSCRSVSDILLLDILP